LVALLVKDSLAIQKRLVHNCSQTYSLHHNTVKNPQGSIPFGVVDAFQRYKNLSFITYKTNDMNFDLRKWMPLILLGLGAILLLSTCNTYNGAVKLDERVKKMWSQVEVAYQGRLDVVNQLVSTVQGMSEYEKSTLEAIVKARASATSIKIDANNLTPENIAKFEQAQNQLQGTLQGAMKSLLVVNEQYPQLQAAKGYQDLMVAIEGNERRIGVARKDFNESVNAFNSKIRQFPASLLMGLFGFTPKGYFQSASGSEVAPTIKFGK
jgi:LemA protein